MPHWTSHEVSRWNADVGGDHQASDCWETRYTDACLGAVATVYWYAITLDNDTFGVEQQTELITCEDVTQPGDTETWSDADYRTYPQTYQTAQEAERVACEYAHAHRAGDLTWDGAPR